MKTSLSEFFFVNSAQCVDDADPPSLFRNTKLNCVFGVFQLIFPFKWIEQLVVKGDYNTITMY